MTRPRPKKQVVKKVKAWAVLTHGKLLSPSDIRTTKSGAKIYARFDSGVVVPCIITFTPPRLKK